MENAKQKVSKSLSFILRHDPQSIGLTLDPAGWARVTDLLKLTGIKRGALEEVVFNNDKQRFAFSPDGKMIRANQGHSVAGVNLKLQPQTPPEKLYHGTVGRSLDSIYVNGLQKMARHHVHLSATEGTAQNVGSRRGHPIVLSVDALAMTQDGFVFYLSANGVWLTDHVPKRYLFICVF